jgi:hypothetical protein
LGITAIEMARRPPPISDLAPQRVIMYIPQDTPPWLDLNHSLEFCDILGQCLIRDLAFRPAVNRPMCRELFKRARRQETLLKYLDEVLRIKTAPGDEDGRNPT